MEDNRFSKELMISDIQDNNLTGMLNNRRSDRLVIVSVLYLIVLFVFLIFIFPLMTRLLNIRNIVGKILLFIVIAGIGYYWVIDTIVMQRKKRDQKIQKLLSSGGDMINYFMKIKDFRPRHFNIPYNVTIVEGLTSRIVPTEVTYEDMDEYRKLLDSINSLGISYQEFELKGRITLFDKSRARYGKFEGMAITRFLESIFRENENNHKNSPSRRLYMFMYIPYSTDIDNVVTDVVASSMCNFQFLTERTFKEVVEQYFCAPVNLERLKSNNKIKNISLDGTMLLTKKESQLDIEAFLETYSTVKTKSQGSYRKIKGRKERSNLNGRKQRVKNR